MRQQGKVKIVFVAKGCEVLSQRIPQGVGGGGIRTRHPGGTPEPARPRRPARGLRPAM